MVILLGSHSTNTLLTDNIKQAGKKRKATNSIQDLFGIYYTTCQLKRAVFLSFKQTISFPYFIIWPPVSIFICYCEFAEFTQKMRLLNAHMYMNMFVLCIFYSAIVSWSLYAYNKHVK